MAFEVFLSLHRKRHNINLREKPYVKGQMSRSITFVTAVFVLSSVIVAQQFQLRAKVDLVVVPTSVRDDKGKLVTHLTQKDFTVLEDQSPQTILNFSADPQPLSAVVLIDTGMGGIAMRRLVPLFIALTNGFSDFDEMASFRYDHLVFQLSDFTSDHEKIEKSFNVVKSIAEKQPATVPPGDPAPTVPKALQLILGLVNFGGYGGGVDSNTRPPTERVPTVGTRRVSPSRVLFDALYESAKVLEKRPPSRRRIIFIVSDGQVTSGANIHGFGEITDLLLRDNIELYSVNTDSDPIERRLGVLGSLARATGGDEYRGLNTASLESAFNRITEQARNQYVLGYQSTNEPRGGLPVVRTIEVKGRDSRWKVTHRKGYTQSP
jgi:VWFA-related protein